MIKMCSMTEPERPVKVIIVDDHEIVRMGLRALLESKKGTEFAGEASTEAQAVDLARSVRPDVILMDVRLPGGSGVEACRRIRSEMPEIQVLMLTSYSDDEAIFSSILAGASGYILKMIGAEHVYSAILSISRGESLLDPRVSKKIVDRAKEISGGVPTRGIDLLTRREKEILELIADGLTNREIAERIYLSEGSVRNYVSSILSKLGMARRTQAALYYQQRKGPED